jgi:hypothetical protein
MSRMLGAWCRRLAAAWPRPCPAHTDRTGSRLVPLVLHFVPVLVHGTITLSARRPVVRTARASAALPTASVRQQAQLCRAPRGAATSQTLAAAPLLPIRRNSGTSGRLRPLGGAVAAS